MPNVTLVFSLILISLGLWGYLGSTGDDPSVTALIPAFFGFGLLLCGLAALRESWRKHAMHVAATLGLLGCLAAGGRGLSKLGALLANDPELNRRAVGTTLVMAVICGVFVALCVKSFLNARRRRMQNPEA